MKRFWFLTLAFALAGCAAIGPIAPTPVPTGTPQIIEQTVVVTVLVTQLVTQTPSDTPTVTLTPIPSFTSTATAVTGTAVIGSSPSVTPQTPPASATGSSPSATLPPEAGGGLFTNLTRSTDHISLACPPDTVTFGITATDPNVTEVDLFYRMENETGSVISGWVDIGKMTPGEAGNFTMDFPASRIDPDLRYARGWLDYQFVGLNRVGQVLGRSAKIARQISFSRTCPG